MVLKMKIMSGKTCLPAVALCLTLCVAALPATIVHYSFDGIVGQEIPSGLLDDTAAFTAAVIEGSDTNSAITYAGPNPTYNPAGTSALFQNHNWADNAGDTFLIPNAGGIDLSSFDAFTVEAFIHPASAGAGHVRRIFSEHFYAYMYLDAANTLHAYRKWGSGNWQQNVTHLSVPNFDLDTWSHVAMVWNAHTDSDKFKLYVNGRLRAATAGTSSATLDSTAGFVIGGYQREDGSTTQFFHGSIDEFRLSDAALDPSEFLGATAVLSFDSSDSRAAEHTGTVELTVTLSNPQEDQTYTVDYAATGGTAIESVDYAPVAGTLTFYPGQTARIISISIIDDGIDEDDETIEVTLSNPTGGDLALGEAAVHTYTILDPRPRVEFAAEAGTVSERVRIIHRPVKIPVGLSVASRETVTVVYVVAGGTAARDVDYVLRNGILSFAPGQVKADISFYVVDDNIRESDETIVLRLFDPTGGSLLGSKTQYRLTITDGGRMAPPNFDLSQDGEVNFNDVAILVTRWLECTLDPPQLCWQ